MILSTKGIRYPIEIFVFSSSSDFPCKFDPILGNVAIVGSLLREEKETIFVDCPVIVIVSAVITVASC